MYDLIIVGAGPAGLSASIYASCFHLSHIVLGKVLGGQMSLAPDIFNYPGFEEISGKELTEKMVSQVKKRGADIFTDSVVRINKTEQGFELTTETERSYSSKAIILATGTERRKLNVPGENEYTGKGIEYCATCDKLEENDKTAAIIGGANSAAKAAIEITRKADKAYIIHRGSELRCDPILLEEIKNNPKIEIIFNTVVEEICGNGSDVNKIKIKSSGPSFKQTELAVDKIYIEIGGVPGTALIIPLGVEVDSTGLIKVNDELSTNIPGVFATGDVISYKMSIEQISSAVGLGAKAAMSAYSYLKGQKSPTLWGQSHIRR